jgi:hypothetical protein
MKKLLMVLILGLLVAPVSAWGQQWVDPHYNIDGTYVEGHWKTPEDDRQERYSTPGKVNPYTGQFNPYTTGLKTPQPSSPPPKPANPLGLPDYRPHYQIPGSEVKVGK